MQRSLHHGKIIFFIDQKNIYHQKSISPYTNWMPELLCWESKRKRRKKSEKLIPIHLHCKCQTKKEKKISKWKNFHVGKRHIRFLRFVYTFLSYFFLSFGFEYKIQVSERRHDLTHFFVNNSHEFSWLFSEIICRSLQGDRKWGLFY